MMVRSSHDDWKRNLETILMWSPYASEEDLLQEVSLTSLLFSGLLSDNNLARPEVFM